MRRTLVVAVGLVCAAAYRLSAADGGGEMALVPVGEYRPLYQTSDADGKPLDKRTETVAAFWLDKRPVSEGEYLAFVAARPKWRRSRAPQLFADENYLAHWRDDLAPPPHLTAPAVNVSWFAAMAYCRWRGKILPTTAQWERAAAASETVADAAGDAAFQGRILDWYARPAGKSPTDGESSAGGFRNYYGIFDLHGGVWEWTSDFNSALVTGESRGDSALSRQLFCGAAALGAADFEDYAAFMRFGFRSSLQGDYAVSGLGFRCARPAADAERKISG